MRRSLIAPARAEDVSISQEPAAGGLHEGVLELTATFRVRATDDEPMRIMMPMQDRDALAFGIPGYEGALYSFARSGQ